MPQSPENAAIDRRYYRTPGLWPGWPFLPLKRYHADRGMETVYLVDEPRTEGFTLYKGNMWSASKDDPIFKTYPTVEAIQADGWIVD